MLGILLLTLSFQVTPVDPTTIHFFSSLAGQQFDSAVTQALLDAAPKWATDAETPPLSPKTAIDAAHAQLAKLTADADRWTVDSISLQSVGLRRDWIYVVRFRGEPAPARGRSGAAAPGSFQLIVLLNGSVVEPKRR